MGLGRGITRPLGWFQAMGLPWPHPGGLLLPSIVELLTVVWCPGTFPPLPRHVAPRLQRFELTLHSLGDPSVNRRGDRPVVDHLQRPRRNSNGCPTFSPCSEIAYRSQLYFTGKPWKTRARPANSLPEPRSPSRETLVQMCTFDLVLDPECHLPLIGEAIEIVMWAEYLSREKKLDKES